MRKDELRRMREPANSQQGGVKRFTYSGPNSSKDNSPGPPDDWFSGLPAKSKSEQSLHGSNTELDDVWSIRKNVSASLNLPTKQATTAATNNTTGYYSRHGQYNKSSKLNEDTSAITGSDGSGFGKSGGYSYGQSRSSYSYAGAAGVGPGQSTSPRFTTGPSTTTQGSGRGSGGIGPPLVSGNRSPTRSNTSRSLESQFSRGRGSDGWSSF